MKISICLSWKNSEYINDLSWLIYCLNLIWTCEERKRTLRSIEYAFNIQADVCALGQRFILVIFKDLEPEKMTKLIANILASLIYYETTTTMIDTVVLILLNSEKNEFFFSKLVFYWDSRMLICYNYRRLC